jgi:hypothetical protein
VAGAEGGYLTLLDTYDSAWRVRVDGQPAPLLRANALFRAVRLTRGEHVVEFRYRPTPLYAGGTISLVTLFGLLLPWPSRLSERIAGAIRQTAPLPAADDVVPSAPDDTQRRQRAT